MTSGTVVGLVEDQLRALSILFPGSVGTRMPDNTVLVTVPRVRLPGGWSQQETSVSFLIPVGYPMARPDCFWADPNLRLAGGAMPQNVGVSPVPGTAEPRLWFSWHLQAWNPVTDTLLTYVRVIQQRFQRMN